MYEVSSEIYSETDFQPTKCENGRVVSKFQFDYPTSDINSTVDKDGDLDVKRKNCGVIEIEHSGSTVLKLVGLQVWRGALLLADFFFHNRQQFADKQILELGAGVGLTSIAAAVYCKQVICTDVDIGGILDLIRKNVDRNRKLLQNGINVLECDFKATEHSPELTNAIKSSDVIIAADVIYDDDLTECFIHIIDRILATDTNKKKTIYIALEKRYVFTLDDLETVAPCFEHFLKIIDPKPWRVEYIPIDFPQYFKYERCKHLILLKEKPQLQQMIDFIIYSRSPVIRLANCNFLAKYEFGQDCVAPSAHSIFEQNKQELHLCSMSQLWVDLNIDNHTGTPANIF